VSDDPLEPEAVLSLVQQIRRHKESAEWWHTVADERSAEIVRLTQAHEQALNERDAAHEALACEKARGWVLDGEKGILLRRLANRNHAIRTMSRFKIDFDAPEDTRPIWPLLQLVRVQAMEADREALHYAHQLRQLWRRCKEAERDNRALVNALASLGCKLHIERAVSRHWLVRLVQVAGHRDRAVARIEWELLDGGRVIAAVKLAITGSITWNEVGEQLEALLGVVKGSDWEHE
jgi:hypothetical protein